MRLIQGFIEIGSAIKTEFSESGMKGVLSVNMFKTISNIVREYKEVLIVIAILLLAVMYWQMYNAGYSIGKLIYYITN